MYLKRLPAFYKAHRTDYYRYEIVWSWSNWVLGLFYFPTIFQKIRIIILGRPFLSLLLWFKPAGTILTYNPKCTATANAIRRTWGSGMTNSSIFILLSSQRLQLLKRGWVITSIFVQFDDIRASWTSYIPPSIVSTVFRATRLTAALREGI